MKFYSNKSNIDPNFKNIELRDTTLYIERKMQNFYKCLNKRETRIRSLCTWHMRTYPNLEWISTMVGQTLFEDPLVGLFEKKVHQRSRVTIPERWIPHEIEEESKEIFNRSSNLTLSYHRVLERIFWKRFLILMNEIQCHDQGTPPKHNQHSPPWRELRLAS